MDKVNVGQPGQSFQGLAQTSATITGRTDQLTNINRTFNQLSYNAALQHENTFAPDQHLMLVPGPQQPYLAPSESVQSQNLSHGNRVKVTRHVQYLGKQDQNAHANIDHQQNDQSLNSSGYQIQQQNFMQPPAVIQEIETKLEMDERNRNFDANNSQVVTQDGSQPSVNGVFSFQKQVEESVGHGDGGSAKQSTKRGDAPESNEMYFVLKPKDLRAPQQMSQMESAGKSTVQSQNRGGLMSRYENQGALLQISFGDSFNNSRGSKHSINRNQAFQPSRSNVAMMQKHRLKQYKQANKHQSPPRNNYTQRLQQSLTSKQNFETVQQQKPLQIMTRGRSLQHKPILQNAQNNTIATKSAKTDNIEALRYGVGFQKMNSAGYQTFNKTRLKRDMANRPNNITQNSKPYARTDLFGPTKGTQVTSQKKTVDIVNKFNKTNQQLESMLKPDARKNHQNIQLQHQQNQDLTVQSSHSILFTNDYIKQNKKKVDIFKKQKLKQDISFQADTMYNQIQMGRQQAASTQYKNLSLFDQSNLLDQTQFSSGNQLNPDAAESYVNYDQYQQFLHQEQAYNANFNDFKNLQQNFARKYIQNQEAKMHHHTQQLHMINTQRSDIIAGQPQPIHSYTHAQNDNSPQPTLPFYTVTDGDIQLTPKRYGDIQDATDMSPETHLRKEKDYDNMDININDSPSQMERLKPINSNNKDDYQRSNLTTIIRDEAGQNTLIKFEMGQDYQDRAMSSKEEIGRTLEITKRTDNVVISESKKSEENQLIHNPLNDSNAFQQQPREQSNQEKDEEKSARKTTIETRLVDIVTPAGSNRGDSAVATGDKLKQNLEYTDPDEKLNKKTDKDQIMIDQIIEDQNILDDVDKDEKNCSEYYYKMQNFVIPQQIPSLDEPLNKEKNNIENADNSTGSNNINRIQLNKQAVSPETIYKLFDEKPKQVKEVQNLKQSVDWTSFPNESLTNVKLLHQKELVRISNDITDIYKHLPENDSKPSDTIGVNSTIPNQGQNIHSKEGMIQTGPNGGQSLSSSIEGHHENEDPSSSVIMKAMGPRMQQENLQSSGMQQLKYQGATMNFSQNKLKKHTAYGGGVNTMGNQYTKTDNTLQSNQGYQKDNWRQLTSGNNNVQIRSKLSKQKVTKTNINTVSTNYSRLNPNKLNQNSDKKMTQGLTLFHPTYPKIAMALTQPGYSLADQSQTLNTQMNRQFDRKTNKSKWSSTMPTKCVPSQMSTRMRAQSTYTASRSRRIQSKQTQGAKDKSVLQQQTIPSQRMTVRPYQLTSSLDAGKPFQKQNYNYKEQIQQNAQNINEIQHWSGQVSNNMDLLEGELITETLQVMNDDSPKKAEEFKDLLKSQSAKGLLNQNSPSQGKSFRREVVRVTSGKVLRASEGNNIIKNAAPEIREQNADKKDEEDQQQFQNSMVKKGLQSVQNYDSDDQVNPIDQTNQGEQIKKTIQSGPNVYSQTSNSDNKGDVQINQPKKIVSKMLTKNQKEKVLIEKIMSQGGHFQDLYNSNISAPKITSKANSDGYNYDIDHIREIDLENLNLEMSYLNKFTRVDGFDAERVLRDIDNSKPVRVRRNEKFQQFVQHTIQATRCASAIQSGKKGILSESQLENSTPMRILKKFTENIIRKHHSPLHTRQSELMPKQSRDGEQSEESIGDREEWEKSQRSSGLVERQEDVELDIKRFLYKLMKDKFIGKVHKDFVKRARNLNDGTNRTYGDNVGLYSNQTKYTIQPRHDDHCKHVGYRNRSLVNQIKKTRTEADILKNQLPNMPVYRSYIEFRTQLKRPEIQKVLSKQDSCTKNIDFNHSYEAVDEKTWIQANNTHLFDNQLSHETYYPGKQTVHMNEPQQKPFYFLE